MSIKPDFYSLSETGFSLEVLLTLLSFRFCSYYYSIYEHPIRNNRPLDTDSISENYTSEQMLNSGPALRNEELDCWAKSAPERDDAA